MGCFHGIQFNTYVYRKYNKVVQRLPNYLHQTFYRHTREIIETEVISLLVTELWLGNGMKELYNPIADIITSQESNRKKDPLKTINAGCIRGKEEVKCWFCSKKHKITTCENFISSSINAKNKFVKANKPCWNCLGKGHNIKNCQSRPRCKVANCNKHHHTLLHNGNITQPLATNLHYQSIKYRKVIQMMQSILIISNYVKHFYKFYP